MSAAVLFGGHGTEVILENGESHCVPWEVVEQADPGREYETVLAWAGKSGLLPMEDVRALQAA